MQSILHIVGPVDCHITIQGYGSPTVDCTNEVAVEYVASLELNGELFGTIPHCMILPAPDKLYTAVVDPVTCQVS